MKWFKRWFARQCREAWEDANKIETDSVQIKMSRGSLRDGSDTMNFQIHCATGGYVLEYTHWDRKTDHTERRLHIIPDNQDLGEGVAQVITVEMLRK